SAQERHAAAGVVLPAVFTVEDDVHERRRPAVDGVANRANFTEKIDRRTLALAPLIVKADEVAQGMIAKDDPKLSAPFLHFVRLVHLLRIANEAATVAAHQPMRRLAEDFLIGRNPADAVLREEWNQALADRTFRRPHSPGRLTEHFLVIRHRLLNVPR